MSEIGVASGRFLGLAVALLVAGAAGALVAPLQPEAQEQIVVPAFPGAEGHGAKAVGGRGGRVIEVTNLNDSGPGSFRAAVTATGPRTVVFRVGGLIDLQSPIAITNPYLTIAGQTAPGSGICLRNAPVTVRTHDVIARYLRFRPGDNAGGSSPYARDGVVVNGSSGVYNVIIDHSSMSWGIDENANIEWPARDVTFQWNIVSEGLRNSLHPKGAHSMGLLLGEGAKRVSIHHNLFAHNAGRNPRVKHDTEVEIVNNVMYNWSTGTSLGGGTMSNGAPEPTIYKIKTNIIGNYYRPGADTPDGRKGIEILGGNIGRNVFVKGNIGPGRSTDSLGEWKAVQIQQGSASYYRASSPRAAVSGIATQSAKGAYAEVMDKAGATRPVRDTVDERVVRSVRDGKGRIIDSQEQVGGWPAYHNGTPPADADHDGMPDGWEEQRGLDPNNAEDGPRDKDGDGYTNAEEYLNSLA